jgi:HEAT repeat protein
MSIFSFRGAGIATAALGFAASGAACTAGAQSLAQRVASARDGRVVFSFAARPGVCGDGHGTLMVSSSDGYSSGGISYFSSGGGMAGADRCQAGPVRVALDRADHQIVGVRTAVGPADTSDAAVDLGTVPARVAADYLLSLASTLDGRPAHDAILPAMLADSTDESAALLGIARNQSLSVETRRSALSGLGRSAGAASGAATTALVGVARNDADNTSVRQQALNSLAQLDRGAGLPALIDIANGHGGDWLTREAVAAIGRSGDPRGRAFLRAAIRRTDLPDDARRSAIRSLGSNYATARDAAVIRDAYATFNTEAQRLAAVSAVASLGGSDNIQWLVALAQNPTATVGVRRRAVSLLSDSGDPRALSAVQQLVVRQ